MSRLPQDRLRPGSGGPIIAPAMFIDPIFDRHRHQVWPFFWPVFALAIALFRRRAGALLADGCLSIGYEVSPFGTIRITDTVFPGASACWKDSLFSAIGAYKSQTSVTPGSPRDLHPQSTDPAEIQALLIIALNCVLLRRVEPQRHLAQSAHEGASLPLPHT